MNELQIKALDHAVSVLQEAKHIVLMHGDKPDFQPMIDRRSKGHEVMSLIDSAVSWINAIKERQ